MRVLIFATVMATTGPGYAGEIWNWPLPSTIQGTAKDTSVAPWSVHSYSFQEHTKTKPTPIVVVNPCPRAFGCGSPSGLEEIAAVTGAGDIEHWTSLSEDKLIHVPILAQVSKVIEWPDLSEATTSWDQFNLSQGTEDANKLIAE